MPRRDSNPQFQQANSCRPIRVIGYYSRDNKNKWGWNGPCMQHVWESWLFYAQFQPENLKERGAVEFEDIDGWITLKYEDSTLCVEVYLAQVSVSREILWTLIIIIIIITILKSGYISAYGGGNLSNSQILQTESNYIHYKFKSVYGITLCL